MASATAAKAPSGAAAQAEASVTVSPPSRREFLYYIWGASVVMVLGQVGVGVLWFSYPRFAEGTFGGTFQFDPANLPVPGGAPVSVPSGRFHVSHLSDESLVVLYGVCTHLGCLPPWTPANDRFECPCHGSKFERNGAYIEGPAPRSMDRFVTTVTFEDGSTATTDAEGNPIPIAGRRVTGIAVDTGTRVRRTGDLAKL